MKISHLASECCCLAAVSAVRCQDFSPNGQFAPWTFRPAVDISPHARFAHRRFEKGAKRPWGEKSIKGKVSNETGDHLTRQVLVGDATSPILPEGGPEIDVNQVNLRGLGGQSMR